MLLRAKNEASMVLDSFYIDKQGCSNTKNCQTWDLLQIWHASPGLTIEIPNKYHWFCLVYAKNEQKYKKLQYIIVFFSQKKIDNILKNKKKQ